MKGVVKNWQYFCAGLYAWIVTIFFGMILLDIVYSRVAAHNLEPAQTAATFSQVADFLLLIGALTVLTGVGAIGCSWNLGAARNLFIASLLFVMVEFVTPMFFFSQLQKMQVNLGPSLGMWIRLIGSALSSVLAFAGLWKLHPST